MLQRAVQTDYLLSTCNAIFTTVYNLPSSNIFRLLSSPVVLIVLPELSYLFFFHYAWGFTFFEHGKIIKQARGKLLETRGTKR